MIRCTVLYDNTSVDPALQAEWGFSCLVEGPEKTILFDTGGNPGTLAANFQQLQIDPQSIDIVVVSHMHWDHINGLQWLLTQQPNLAIFLPDGPEDDEPIKAFEKISDRIIRVSEPIEICRGFLSTGILPGRKWEQALCIDTSDGLTVITGCSHPGVVDMLARAKELSGKSIELAFGGFHLKDHSKQEVQTVINELKALGVQRVGPTHCTGDAAIEMFKQAWGDRFVRMGAGRTFTIPLNQESGD